MSQIKFWYAIKIEEQLDFEGHAHAKKVPAGEVHLVYSEVLMCRQSRERLKNEIKATGHSVVSILPKGIKLCEKCKKKYMEHPDLEWQKWLNPPAPKSPPPPVLNPQLLQVNNETR